MIRAFLTITITLSLAYHLSDAGERARADIRKGYEVQE